MPTLSDYYHLVIFHFYNLIFARVDGFHPSADLLKARHSAICRKGKNMSAFITQNIPSSRCCNWQKSEQGAESLAKITANA